MWRDRECIKCGEVLHTASKSEICLICKTKSKVQDAIANEREIIEDYGYEIVNGPIKNKFGKRVYTLKAECCGGIFETVYGNLISGIKKNEKSGYGRLPCGNCGPKARMAKAMLGYMEKNRRDYDVRKFKGYAKEVRALSEQTYNENIRKLNPHGFKRGLAGTEGAYHLDHKIPIIECFKRGWPPEKAATVENLQLLSWEDNLSKGSQFIT